MKLQVLEKKCISSLSLKASFQSNHNYPEVSK